MGVCVVAEVLRLFLPFNCASAVIDIIDKSSLLVLHSQWGAKIMGFHCVSGYITYQEHGLLQKENCRYRQGPDSLPGLWASSWPQVAAHALQIRNTAHAYWHDLRQQHRPLTHSRNLVVTLTTDINTDPICIRASNPGMFQQQGPIHHHGLRWWYRPHMSIRTLVIT